jgi:3-isopropylmalate dehydrogenase
MAGLLRMKASYSVILNEVKNLRSWKLQWRIDLMKKRVVVFPGDGIGPEVTEQAKLILIKVAGAGNLKLDIQEFQIGGASIDAYGVPLKEEYLKAAKRADAVLLGAVGGPKWDIVEPSIRPEKALLALRKGLKTYANLRPAKPYPALLKASTLGTYGRHILRQAKRHKRE